MNDALTLVTKHFAESKGELLVGGLPVRPLAETYGTPLFVYDKSVMVKKQDALATALPKRFSIYFSVKANPHLGVLRHFVSRGCGLEIASAGEFCRALEAGCDPSQIVFAGPGKSEAELKLVLSKDIGEIHLESLTEAQRISAICRRLGTRSRVAIRVNPSADAEGGAMRMGGRSTPFGIDEELLDEVLNIVLEDPSFEFTGIHMFAGTQILDAATLASQYRHGLEIGRRASKRAGRPLHTLDFGGGWGIPYFAHEKELDLERLHTMLEPLFAEVERDDAFRGSRFLVEPGRFLVGEAGLYLARINDIKISRDKKFLVLDGGMNHHLAASGNLGQTIKRNYPIAIVNKLATPPEETVEVVGPLCTPLDTLARSILLPRAEIGDLIGIFNSGAYGRSASPLGFLSHPAPPEVLVHMGHHESISDSTCSENSGYNSVALSRANFVRTRN